MLVIVKLYNTLRFRVKSVKGRLWNDSTSLWLFGSYILWAVLTKWRHFILHFIIYLFFLLFSFVYIVYLVIIYPHWRYLSVLRSNIKFCYLYAFVRGHFKLFTGLSNEDRISIKEGLYLWNYPNGYICTRPVL